MAYCDRCDRPFGTVGSLNQHKQNSLNHYLCCGKDFLTYSRQQQHWSGSPTHHYCLDCDRHFQNENNFVNHRNSSIHHPKDILCPSGCGMSFVSNSALVLHLEAGYCSSGINRDSVNRFVRRYDRNNVITDPSRFITYGSGDDDEDISYIATRESWNGSGFECYFCNNVYRKLKQLNQHLASPAHQQKFYICRGPECSSNFSTLSALCQHIESGKCGVQKFRMVQSAMDQIFGKMKRLT